MTGCAAGVCGLGGLRAIPPSLPIAPRPPPPLSPAQNPLPPTHPRPLQPAPWTHRAARPSPRLAGPGVPRGSPGLPPPSLSVHRGPTGGRRRSAPGPAAAPRSGHSPATWGSPARAPPPWPCMGSPRTRPGLQVPGERRVDGGAGAADPSRPFLLLFPSSLCPSPAASGSARSRGPDPPRAAFRTHALPGFSGAANVAIWPRRGPPGRPPTGAEADKGRCCRVSAAGTVSRQRPGSPGWFPFSRNKGGRGRKGGGRDPAPLRRRWGPARGGERRLRYRGWRTAALPGAGCKVATGRRLQSPDPTGQERQQQPQRGRTDGPGAPG